VTSPFSSSDVAPWCETQPVLRIERLAMWLCGISFFVQFLAMAFASFPLQTHLRKLLDPSSASLVAGLTPIATLTTYLLFRIAESLDWTRFPRRSLAFAALLLAIFQGLLGWQMNRIDAGRWILEPALDIGVCMLLMGCANAGCMILLNHIAVATLKEFAYVVRAAGTAGYMVAVILLGSIWSDSKSIECSHLFVAASISLIHAAIAWGGVWWIGNPSPESFGHSPTSPSIGVIGRGDKLPREQGSELTWWGLLALVWLVSTCEIAYGLYSHEFMTQRFGTFGYYLFATGLGVEIALLLIVSRAKELRQRLLFLGPLGWILVMVGGLFTIGGFAPLGVLTLAMALNCPFQMSVNEHVHRIDTRVLGIASVSLAQALGFLSAAGLSALVSRAETGPRNLWLCMIPVAMVAMALSIWKLKRMQQTEEPS
jgi:hypothetical protein